MKANKATKGMELFIRDSAVDMPFSSGSADFFVPSYRRKPVSSFPRSLDSGFRRSDDPTAESRFMRLLRLAATARLAMTGIAARLAMTGVVLFFSSGAWADLGTDLHNIGTCLQGAEKKQSQECQDNCSHGKPSRQERRRCENFCFKQKLDPDASDECVKSMKNEKICKVSDSVLKQEARYETETVAAVKNYCGRSRKSQENRKNFEDKLDWLKQADDLLKNDLEPAFLEADEVAARSTLLTEAAQLNMQAGKDKTWQADARKFWQKAKELEDRVNAEEPYTADLNSRDALMIVSMCVEHKKLQVDEGKIKLSDVDPAYLDNVKRSVARIMVNLRGIHEEVKTRAAQYTWFENYVSKQMGAELQEVTSTRVQYFQEKKSNGQLEPTGRKKCADVIFGGSNAASAQNAPSDKGNNENESVVIDTSDCDPGADTCTPGGPQPSNRPQAQRGPIKVKEVVLTEEDIEKAAEDIECDPCVTDTCPEGSTVLDTPCNEDEDSDSHTPRATAQNDGGSGAGHQEERCAPNGAGGSMCQ